MEMFRIKDNCSEKKVSFSGIPVLTNKIAGKTLEQLERDGVFVFPELVREADDLTRDQMILQGVNDCYRTGNVMGFIGCGNERLVIGSRFSDDGSDFFLHYLLDRVLDIPNVVDLETDTSRDSRLFNFLLFLFPHYLRSAMRKGLFKSYICHGYNDLNVKGNG